MSRNIFSVVALLFLASISASSVVGREDTAEAPELSEPDINLFPGFPMPSEEYLEYVARCLQGLSQNCLKEVAVGTIRRVSPGMPVSKECCRQLVKIGRDCHLGVIRTIFPEISGSERIWDECAGQVGAETGAPIPLEMSIF